MLVPKEDSRTTYSNIQNYGDNSFSLFSICTRPWPKVLAWTRSAYTAIFFSKWPILEWVVNCKFISLLTTLRAVHILPNRFVGTVGEHDDFPVERMRLSRDGDILASCSHDQSIKFWDVSHLKTIHVDPGSKKKSTAVDNTTNDFFADL